ncbi:MAG TPA: protease modulator HflC [Solimonas sp.]|nr:protease modulator HflC [Solimonas sp.]
MTKNPAFWLIAAFVALITLSSSIFIVDQRERVVLFQFGQIKGTDFAPGLHLKTPFLQSVFRFDGRILTLDNQTENFLTGEKKNVEVDFYAKWRIADAGTYYRATRGQEIVASDRLASILNRGLRDQFGGRTIQQLVSDRDSIITEVAKDAADKVKSLGIAVVDIRIKSINLPKDADVTDSVYNRMRAERSRVASDLRARGAEEAEKIRAEADREAQTTLANSYKKAETLKGEGDAKAAEVYAKAYGQDPEFYSFYRSLNVYRDAFSGGQNIMVLEPRGELFRYFKGDGK